MIGAIPSLARSAIVANLILALVLLGVLVYAGYNVALCALAVASYFTLTTHALLSLILPKGRKPRASRGGVQTPYTPPAGGQGANSPNFVSPVEDAALKMGFEWVAGLYTDGYLLDPDKVHLQVKDPRYRGMLRIKAPAPEIAQALKWAGFLFRRNGNWFFDVDNYLDLPQAQKRMQIMSRGEARGRRGEGG